MKKNRKKTRKQRRSGKKKGSDFFCFHPVNKAAEAVIYFGFTPSRPVQVCKDDTSKVCSLKDSWTRNVSGMPWVFSQPFAEERVALLREYEEKKLSSLPQPVMLTHETDIIKERAKSTINLEVMGTEKSIAEAMLIKTAISVLKDNGYKEFVIEINSIGDKESMGRFGKELTSYYKKNLNSLGAHCRQNFKKDAFYVLHCSKCEMPEKIKEAVPTSISCLSDISRTHFKEVLEYIETIGIPYKINNCLVPDRKYCSGTIYEIKEVASDGNAGDTLAVGFRYDGIATKVGHKKDKPGAGIKIFIPKKAIIKKISKLKKPIAFYIQLGDEAKHKSLEVIDMLRKEKIFVHHMLGRDKFGSQFAHVERSKVPYVIIMGKKEFIDNSVMVRENTTRTQENVPIHKLTEHIRSKAS
ncbi:MAG: His/Gly/Thr/Pro-type tRNA ligase C-terminal domain-containing protein [Candidatus Paceibacterota bacterium]|jgi:histidyl-tRNA synthetase